MGKYDDIINLDRPKSKHIPMDITDRAKIFAPFAALRGYEDVIDENRKTLIHRVELTEDEKCEINRKLMLLKEKLDSGMSVQIAVTYYSRDDKISEREGEDMGYRVLCEGVLYHIDESAETVTVGDCIIRFDEIYSMTL